MATEVVEKPVIETSSLTKELSIQDIQGILPHRYPFLLVDRVTKIDPGKHIEGYKNVTMNEPFFQGHFPGLPIMPGVLIVEAMAQLGCILIRLLPEVEGKLVLFAGIEHLRFRRQVVPGDKLEMEADLLKIRGAIGKAQGHAHVNGEVAISGTFLFSMIPDTRGDDSDDRL